MSYLLNKKAPLWRFFVSIFEQFASTDKAESKSVVG